MLKEEILAEKLMDNASSLSSALLRENQEKEGEGAKKKEVSKPLASLGKPRTFKIIVLGESGVGKTCLSFRFCAGKFPLITEATIGLDFREKVGCRDRSSSILAKLLTFRLSS